MVNWQVTATTFYCDAVNEEVTLLVYKDFSVKCTGYNKRSAKAGKTRPGCQGLDCPRVTQYRDKLRAEESTAK